MSVPEFRSAIESQFDAVSIFMCPGMMSFIQIETNMMNIYYTARYQKHCT